jgi:SAM-dependent methyltransferase
MVVDAVSGLDPVAKVKSYVKLNEDLVERILRLKDLHPLRLVLDLACGTGLISKLFLKQAEAMELDTNVVCLDMDMESLQTAKSELNNERTGMIAAVAQALPLKTGFDLVFFCNSIHMLDHEAKEKAVQDIHRVLRDGGHLVISTSYYEGCYPEETKKFYMNWVKNAIAIMNRKLPNREKGERVAAMDWLTPEQYADLLERNGFQVSYLDNHAAVLPQNFFRAISEYRDFAIGALRAAERDAKAASTALKQAVRPAFQASGIRLCRRNWLEIAARKV